MSIVSFYLSKQFGCTQIKKKKKWKSSNVRFVKPLANEIRKGGYITHETKLEMQMTGDK